MSTFIFNKSALEQNIHKLKNSFQKYHDNFQIFYSVKTNYSKQVIETIVQNNCCLEVVSDYEWSLIKHLKPTQMVLNGPSKNRELVIDMLNNGVETLRFNIDNDTDITVLDSLSDEQKSKIQIGIRVYPNKSGIWNRFGFDIDSPKFMEIFEKVKDRLAGFHFHFSTNNFQISSYELILQKITKLIQEHNLSLKYIDIGGGLPGSSEIIYQKTIYEDLPKLVSQYISKDILVISEVGRNLVENVFDLDATIVSVKDFGDTMDVVIDTNIMHFPCFWEKKFDVEIKSNSKNPNQQATQVNIYGNSCMQIDKIQQAYFCGFKPIVEDSVIITKVGAYSITQASNFITQIPKIK